MKAVQFAQYGDPDVLQVREVPDPTPGPGDVLVQVKATTVNRLDLFQRNGSRPVDKLPFTPGLEAAGIVVKDSQGFHAGERVMTTHAARAVGGGGYASMIAVPAEDLVRIPDGVSFEEAVAAGLTASTAWGSLFDIGRVKAGERAGAGFHARAGKQAGAWVVTTTSSNEKVSELRRLGADMVINQREENVAEVIQNNVHGVNLVIELVSTTIQTSIESCTQDGRIVLVGNLGGQQASIDMQQCRLKRVHIIGGGMLHTSTENERRILEMIAAHAVTPVIAETLPVEQAAEAHRRVAAGKTLGKIVLLHS